MNMFNEAMNNAGSGLTEYGADTIALYKTPSPQNPSFNWQKFMIHSANIVNHSLSIGGRTGNTNFEGAMGIWNQDGIVTGFSYKKYTGMFNLESQVTKGLKLGVTTNLLVDNQVQPYNGESDEILAIRSQLPDYQPYLLDGSGNFANRAWAFESPQKNPLAAASAGGDWTTDFKFNATAYTRLNILKNLVWEVKGAMFYSESDNKVQTPVVPVYDYRTNQFYQNMNNNGTISLSEAESKTPYYTIYSTLNYHAAFGNGYHLNALLGVDQENSTTTTLSGYRYGFASNTLTVLSAAPSEGQTTGGDESQYALRSQFGKVNLDYQSKYLFEADFRRDGNSRFPPANKYAYFPSFSAGWRLSQENFIRDNLNWISELKLRASYGQLGNDNVNGNYPYQNVISTGANYPFAGTLDGGVVMSTLSNDKLKWEQTSVKNLGLDYNIKRSLLYGSVDYFLKSTSGILRQEQIPGYAGVGSPYVNEGQVNNKGYEVVIGHKGHINKVGYGAEFNISAYKNKLVKFGAPEYGSSTMLKEGYEMNAYYMYRANGIYQSQAEVTEGPKTPWVESPGDVRIKDVDGDGSVTPNDRVPVKGANPNYYYGLNLFANWNGVDLTIFFQGSQGQKVLVNGEYSGVLPFGGGVPLTYWENAWSAENHSTSIPSLTNFNGPLDQSTLATSTFWLENTSYMRLKNMTIGYTLPIIMTKTVFIKKLRFFASGENLLTFTKYKFGDPESGGNTAYPMMRSLTLGLNVQF
jgi:TonB-linked SusC/RagA family outer membrane protein